MHFGREHTRLDSLARPRDARRWLPEIRYHCPSAQIVLCGTKSDLAADPHTLGVIRAAGLAEPPALIEEAAALAAELGSTLVTCSALTQRGLKNVFDSAIASVLRPAASRAHRGAMRTVGDASWARLLVHRSLPCSLTARNLWRAWPRC